ncbi:MAG: SUMF1/EgtB/PvdO family nonheme iron enzyme [Bacteroidota bacterium]
MLRLPSSLTLSTLSNHMVSIPGGTFRLGDKVDVTLSPYSLCRYPVTQALWASVMKDNPHPSHFKGAQRPVEQVNWYDAVSFCNALSEQQGLAPAYGIDQDTQDPDNQSSFDDHKWTVKLIQGSKGYRLPSEAEWEYAARGGPHHRGFEYAGSPDLDQVGWYRYNSNRETQPVGQKRPNELGLYDLSGNVWEWCWDWGAGYPSEPQVDPIGPEGGSYRVYRGGSWFDDADFSRVAYRNFVYPDSRYVFIGFRLARYV